MKVNVWACLSTDCGKTLRQQSNHALTWASSGVARCNFSECNWESCTARSSRILRLVTPFRYWWKHVTLPHRIPHFVILNWFPCLIGCSVCSSGRLLFAHTITWPLRLIAHAILSLVPLLHFHGTWIYSCISQRLGKPSLASCFPH